MRTVITITLFLAMASTNLLVTSQATAQEGQAFAYWLQPGRFLKFPASDPIDLEFGNIKNISPFALDWNAAGDALYIVDNNTLSVGTLDPVSGAFTFVASLDAGYLGGTVTGLSADPTDGTFYLSGFNVTNQLYTLDVDTGAVTFIADFALPGGNGGSGILIDIAINSKGQMFAHEIDGAIGDGTIAGGLWSVEKTTGLSSFIGTSGLESSFAQGMDFDPDTDILYAAIYTGGGTGEYGTWNTTNASFSSIESLPNFGPVELEISVLGGTTYAYNFRIASQQFLTFPVDMPLPFSSVADNLSYDTFALDFAADGETLYCFDNNSGTIGTIDTDTDCYTAGEIVTGDAPFAFDGLSNDPTTDTFYYVTGDGTFSQLGIVDVGTGETTLVADITADGAFLTAVIDIAFDNDGRLFAFDLGDGLFNPAALYEVDKLTAQATFVGEPGTTNPPAFAQGMDFDPVSNLLYQPIYTGSGTGSYGVWDLDAGTFTEILDLEMFPVPPGDFVELELAIGGSDDDCLLGDVNQDGFVNLEDVDPFVAALSVGSTQCEADIDGDGLVTLEDVDPFVVLLAGGG